MKPYIVAITKEVTNDTVTLTVEELKKMLSDTYEQSYKDDTSSVTIEYPYSITSTDSGGTVVLDSTKTADYKATMEDFQMNM